MTPEQMISHCKWQQELQGTQDAMVTFVMLGIHGDNRRLFGRKGPMGHVVGTRNGGSIVAFKADEVLAALAGTGEGETK